MAVSPGLQLLSELPIELERAILGEVPLLVDQINLADALVSYGHYRIIAVILEDLKSNLTENEEFCKEVFEKIEFASERRSPTSLRPQEDNPHGQTWRALINLDIARNDVQARQRLEAGKAKAIAKHRLDCMLQSRLYREGKDKPSRGNKRNNGLLDSGPRTYSELIEFYRNKGNSDLASQMKQDKEKENDRRGRQLNKAMRILVVLKEVAAEAMAAARMPNMISSAELRQYRMSITNSASLYPVGFARLHVLGRTFTSKGDADMLARMYHGENLDNIRGQVVSGTLVAAQLQQNAATYLVASLVAREAAQMLVYYRNGHVTTCFGFYPGQHLEWALASIDLSPAAIRCIAKSLSADVYTAECWTKAVAFAQDRVLHSGIKINNILQNRLWLWKAAAEYWVWSLRHDYQHHLETKMFAQYQVSRVRELDNLHAKIDVKLDACTISLDEFNELCLQTHGCSPLEILEEIRQDASGAIARRRAYIASSAALISVLNLYNRELTKIWIDLVALTYGRRRDISMAKKRFVFFQDLAMHFFRMFWSPDSTTSFVSVSDVPQALACEKAVAFDTWFHDEPKFFHQLQTCINYLGQLRFLVPHDILSCRNLSMPHFLMAALMSELAAFANRQHPDIKVNCVIGRVAWFEQGTDVSPAG